MDTFNTFNGCDVLTIAAWFEIGDKAWLIDRYGKRRLPQTALPYANDRQQSQG